ncbi:aldehyde dehydrogenase family protein, partial [Streptomyces synnematoformans]|uniref:aldehyde dehydrogenase family protein n=1 Tax=Streptomyces synnematoformans TaxID=415721 RepID=UPI0031D05849
MAGSAAAAPAPPHEHTVVNPATEEPLATVPAAGPAGVGVAVARAAAARRGWAALAAGDLD